MLEDEWPPDAPEDQLREEREIVDDMGERPGQRQKCRNRDQHEIHEDDHPLAALDHALMPPQAFAEPIQPVRKNASARRLRRNRNRRHEIRSPNRSPNLLANPLDMAHFAISTACGALG
jgi:hypothetical protein